MAYQRSRARRNFEKHSNIDKINGHALPYSSAQFPFTDVISNCHQQLHFLFPAKDLVGFFPILGNYEPKNVEARSRLQLATFIAEAVKNSILYRGSKAPRYFQGKDERVQVLITYLPRQVYHNPARKMGLMTREEMLAPENIAGIMLSILLFDSELSFDDAFSDMLDINSRGRPVKTRPPKEKAAPKGRGRAAAPAPANRDDTDSEADSEDEREEEAEEQPPPDEAQQVAEAHQNSERRDVPGKPLDFERKYAFVQTDDWIDGKMGAAYDLNKHTLIKSLHDYCISMAISLGGNPKDPLFRSDDRRLSDPEFRDSPFKPTNAFSLQKAISKMANDLYVCPMLCNVDCWVRGNAFGAPQVFNDSGHEETLPICAKFDSMNLDSFGLLYYRLPHANLLKEQEIEPGNQRKKTWLFAGEDDSNHYCMEDLAAMIGIETVSSVREKELEAQRRPDIFNQRFDQYFSVMSKMEGLRATDPDKWEKMLFRFRTQSKDWLVRNLNGIDNSKLPKGFQAVVAYMEKLGGGGPPVDNLVYSKDCRMSPFCEWVVKDLSSYGRLLSASDGGLMLIREIFIAAASAGMTRMGSELNKLNIRIVGPPASSKSHTLKVAIGLMVPNSQNPFTGTSHMGAVRIESSERLVDIYQELPNNLVPRQDVDGEAERVLKMLLNKVGDGEVNYRHMAKGFDENGRETMKLVDSQTEFTNPIIGAVNPGKGRLDKEGAAAAMGTRFETATLIVPVDKVRNKIAIQTSKAYQKALSEAGLMVNDAHRYRHAMIMLYCAAISSYAVPVPDINLYTDLFPIAIDHLTEIQPEIGMMLRQLARLKTKVYMEVINQGVRLACCSPLSPRFAGSAQLDFDDQPLDPDQAGEQTKEVPFSQMMDEIARYCYTTYAIFIFVLTKCTNELLGGPSLALLRAIARSKANYTCQGDGLFDSEKIFWPRDTQPTNELDPEDERSQLAIQRQLERHSPAAMPMQAFIENILPASKNGLYYLGMPNNEKRANFQRQQNANVMESAYYSYDINGSMIKGIRQTDVTPPTLVRRSVCPDYKIEYTQESEWINPNYLAVKGTLSQLKDTVGGEISNMIMSPSQIYAMLNSMKDQYMSVRCLPCIKRKPNGVMDVAYDQVQSLRYSKTAMNKFIFCKLPVVIEDFMANKTYILVAAVEMNLHSICHALVDRISYAGTPSQTVLFGFPSAKNFWAYETRKLEPRHGIALTITNETEMSSYDRQVLADYTDYLGEEPSSVRTYGSGQDLERIHAWNYLLNNNPGKNHIELEGYLPSGIDDRLHGPLGYYTLNEQARRKLTREAYPGPLGSRPGEVLNPIREESRQELHERQQAFVNQEGDVRRFGHINPGSNPPPSKRIALPRESEGEDDEVSQPSSGLQAETLPDSNSGFGGFSTVYGTSRGSDWAGTNNWTPRGISQLPLAETRGTGYRHNRARQLEAGLEQRNLLRRRREENY